MAQKMSEGGLLRWKIQKANFSRGPVADYSTLSTPLPAPPSGMVWKRDESTKEWSLADQPPATTAHQEEDWSMIESKHRSDSIGSHNSSLSSGFSTFNKSTGSVDFSNVDYVEHVVLPTDTLQGICLAYKISATRLRQANHFSGSTLLLSPKKLIIPTNSNKSYIKLQDRTSKNFKLHAFMAEFPGLRPNEAQAYLELNDWELDIAISNAKDDSEWEKKIFENRPLTTAQVHAAVPLSIKENEVWEELTVNSCKSMEKQPMVASAAKIRNTIGPEDIHKAPPGEFGLELKELSTPLISNNFQEKSLHGEFC